MGFLLIAQYCLLHTCGVGWLTKIKTISAHSQSCHWRWAELGDKKNKHIYLDGQSTNFHFGLNRGNGNRKKFSFSTGFTPKVGNNILSEKIHGFKLLIQTISGIFGFSFRKASDKLDFELLVTKFECLFVTYFQTLLYFVKHF